MKQSVENRSSTPQAFTRETKQGFCTMSAGRCGSFSSQSLCLFSSTGFSSPDTLLSLTTAICFSRVAGGLSATFVATGWSSTAILITGIGTTASSTNVGDTAGASAATGFSRSDVSVATVDAVDCVDCKDDAKASMTAGQSSAWVPSRVEISAACVASFKPPTCDSRSTAASSAAVKCC